MKDCTSRHLTSADANSTVTIDDEQLTLDHITINNTSAYALTVKDGAGNTIAILKASIVESTYWYNVPCVKGIQITVPTGYVGDATICYR